MFDVLTVKYGPDPLYTTAIVRDNTNDNIGFSKAANQLIKKTSADVILLNPDCYPVRDAFNTLARTAYSDPSIGIVQPRMIRSDGSLDSTGHIRKTGRLGIPFFKDRTFEPNSNELESACFACVYIKRETINDVGMLDEQFFLYCEDTDFCLRARKNGWKTVYCSSSMVVHERHGSGNRPDLSKASNLLLLRKHFPKAYLLARMLL